MSDFRLCPRVQTVGYSERMKERMETTGAMHIKGFTVVPVKASDKSERVQYVYLKKLEPRHADREQTKPPERTVFVGNTPPWATKSDFIQAFQCCGKVENVLLQHAPSRQTEEEEDRMTPTSCKKWHRVGYIVFKNKEAVEKAMQLTYYSPVILTSNNSRLSGFARYQEQHLASCSFNVKDVKKKLTEKMEEFDKKEKEEEEAAKNNKPDEEGWVTVTRVGKNKGAPRTEAEDRRVKMKASRKRKRQERVNFYAFQRRETKKQKLEELRQQFQNDKSTIEKMKKERKFRPF